ncbi:metal-dependent hydrolase [Stella sp.]|uniref:metal-dependent hydrolase n=1 Tax=Stella sp. TaxID=2912054 RepID=UPI0035B0A4BF
MDLATHALAGLALARANPAWTGPSSARRGAPALVLLAGALAPDLDMLVVLVDPTRAALLRHTFTHSLVALPAMAAGIAVLARLAGGRLGFWQTAALAAAGIVLHIGLDLLNAYGVVLFHPLSDARVEFGLLFVVDPVLTGVLALGLGLSLLPRLGPGARAAVAATALALALAHVGVAALLRERASDMLAATASAPAVDLVPEPFAPLRWRGILRRPDGYDQYAIRPVANRIERLPSVLSDPEAPAVAAVRRSVPGMALAGFLHAPVWRVEGDRVTVHDLRYRFAELGNAWDPFGFAFEVGPGGAGLGGDRTVRLVGASLDERVGRSLTVLAQILGGGGH